MTRSVTNTVSPAATTALVCPANGSLISATSKDPSGDVIDCTLVFSCTRSTQSTTVGVALAVHVTNLVPITSMTSSPPAVTIGALIEMSASIAVVTLPLFVIGYV